jgi:hypothetical protein
MMTKIQVMLRNRLLLLMLVLMWVNIGRADDRGPDKEEICASNFTWHEAKRARLKLKEKSGTDYSDWLFTIPDRLNLLCKALGSGDLVC